MHRNRCWFLLVGIFVVSPAACWRATPGKATPSIPPATVSVTYPTAVAAVAFSVDGDALAVGLADGNIAIIDLKAKATKATLKGHQQAITSLYFLPDKVHLVSASRDGTARRWEWSKTKEAGTFAGHPGGILTMSVSPDGSRIATSGNDLTVRIWETASQQELHSFKAKNPDPVSSLTYSPDGKMLASIAKEGTNVVLWEAGTGDLLHQLKVSEGSLGFGQSVTFSPDGKRLAVAHGVVDEMDPGSGHVVGKVRKFPPSRWNWGHAVTATYSPAGDWLAVRTTQGKIHVWPAPLAMEVGGEPHKYLDLSPAMIQAAAFSSDGTRLAVGCNDGSVQVFSLAQFPQFEGN
jgi:hypothetical protein